METPGNYRRSLLKLLLFTLSTGIAGAQVNITQAITAANGACPTFPASQTTFQPGTTTVWFDFSYTGGSEGDLFQVEWFQPNGSNYATSKFTQPGTGGTWCYEYNIPILGHAAAGLPGLWTVNLLWNGSQIDSLQFTISPQAPLSDNFTQDSSLNASLWSTNTALLMNIAANFFDGPVTLETPNPSFSSSGMTMKGVNGDGEITGVQANQSFTPPFTTQAIVSGTVANGNAFYLVLMSSDLTQNLIVSGNLNSNNTGNYGINLNLDGNQSVLYTTPALNVFYTITITVNASGTASVSIANAGGTVLASQGGLSIGTDALYLILGQFEGTPVTVGANTAVWQQAAVTSPTVSTPQPSITSGGVVPVYSTATTIQSGEWVSVTNANGTATSTVTLAAIAPSFLLLDAKHVTGIIIRSDGSGTQGGGTYDIIGPTGTSLGYPTVAAKEGDSVELFAVGLGPTTPVVLAGQLFSGAASTNNAVNLVINNVSVTPGFTGISSAGLYQINLTVPAGLGTGDVSLVATVGGAETQAGIVISLQ